MELTKFFDKCKKIFNTCRHLETTETILMCVVNSLTVPQKSLPLLLLSLVKSLQQLTVSYLRSYVPKAVCAKYVLAD